jgi:hypothetical protein
MTSYSEQGHQQQAPAFSPAPSAEVVHQPSAQMAHHPGGPAPLYTTAELVMMERESLANHAIEGVTRLVKTIRTELQQQPIDLETYGQMLGLKEEFYLAARAQIRGEYRRW